MQALTKLCQRQTSFPLVVRKRYVSLLYLRLECWQFLGQQKRSPNKSAWANCTTRRKSLQEFSELHMCAPRCYTALRAPASMVHAYIIKAGRLRPHEYEYVYFCKIKISNVIYSILPEKSIARQKDTPGIHRRCVSRAH